MTENELPPQAVATAPIRSMPTRWSPGAWLCLTDTITVDLLTRVSRVTETYDSDGRERTHSLVVEDACAASWSEPGREVPTLIEGRSVIEVVHRIRGSLSCVDLDGELLELDDTVHLTVAFEVVEIQHILMDMGLRRTQVYRPLLVLRTPFDENDPDDDGIRRAPVGSLVESGADVLVGPLDVVGPASPLPSVESLFLDFYRDLEPSPFVFVQCPRKGTRVELDCVTGELRAAGCHRLNCFVCVRTRAWRASLAVGLARPSHLLLLTDVGMTWQEIERNMKGFARRMRVAEPGVQFCFHVEPSSRGQAHAHAWLHSVSGDDGWVRQAAERSGMGSIAGLQQRRRPAGMPLGYGFKMVLNTNPKLARISEEATTYLDLNRGRLLYSTSTDFWRDADGSRLAGIRAAETAARSVRRSQDGQDADLPTPLAA